MTNKSFEILIEAYSENEDMTLKEFFSWAKEEYPEESIEDIKEDMATLVESSDTIKDYLVKFVEIALDGLDDESLAYWHNKHCEETRDYDNRIWDVETFWAEVWDGDAEATARACYYGSYAPSDNYAKFDGNGNIETFNDVSCEIYEEEIAKTIVDNYDMLEEFIDEYC